MFRVNHLRMVPGEEHSDADLTSPVQAGCAPEDGAPCFRRRLERLGARALTEAELVALILGPGGGTPPRLLAQKLCGRWPDLGRLVVLSAPVLARQEGISLARARRLLAALELGWRARTPLPNESLAVQRPEDLHLHLRREFQGLDRERFLALYLDTRHRVRGEETVSIGTLNASLVHPREVFKSAIGQSAAAVIVAHNHPSGCARPSGDDLELTARLDRCGELLGIPLLDHLVVGDDEIVSIREYGWPG